MNLNLKRPLVVFDLETTGLDMVKDRIIQLSYIKVAPDGTEERGNYLINPQQPISKEVEKLTGITNADVAQAPTFGDVVQELYQTFSGCDFLGYNSNHFDVPMLAEEFLRHGIDFDFSQSNLIDAQVIFHKMEKRNLAAAYKFYCGRKMEEDFQAHRADQDAEATWKVLLGQLAMYNEEKQEEPERVLSADVDSLAAFSKVNDNVDFAGRIVWKPILDAKGEPVIDKHGNVQKQEVFNFGKYKGKPVVEVLAQEPTYYNWMINSDFTNNTKQVLTRIRLRMMSTKG